MHKSVKLGKTTLLKFSGLALLVIVHLIYAKLNLFAMTTCCLALCLPSLFSHAWPMRLAIPMSIATFAVPHSVSTPHLLFLSTIPCNYLIIPMSLLLGLSLLFLPLDLSLFPLTFCLIAVCIWLTLKMTKWSPMDVRCFLTLL